jgi:hypothetical protein
MKNIKLYNPSPSKYSTNIQSHKGKANIHFEYEPDNKYDSEAIMVFTFKKNGERADLGYIQKKEFVGYEYTEEFLKEFDEWENKAYEGLEENGTSPLLEHYMTYVPGKSWYYNNVWSGKLENKYEYLYSEGELEEALEEISNGNMKYIYWYSEGYGVLFDKREV